MDVLYKHRWHKLNPSKVLGVSYDLTKKMWKVSWMDMFGHTHVVWLYGTKAARDLCDIIENKAQQ